MTKKIVEVFFEMTRDVKWRAEFLNIYLLLLLHVFHDYSRLIDFNCDGHSIRTRKRKFIYVNAIGDIFCVDSYVTLHRLTL